MLEKIDSPEDLRNLNSKEMSQLAADIRECIIEQTSRSGGHLASNLGVVELTLALHRVFDSPKDKIIWDVGHQCYPHKLITGRRDQFSTIRQKDGISGFPRMEESPHDIFDAGHASTSLAAALGFELGQRQNHQSGSVIACIGDGSLTGGLALEALNFAGHIPNNLIVVVNDNDMSISRNVGAISSHLTRISSTAPYIRFSRVWSRFWKGIPLIGKPMYNLGERFKRGLKGLILRNRLFSDLGFHYIGPLDGHNMQALEKVFSNLKHHPAGPVVVHVKTLKGKGLKEAEKDPQNYHGISPQSSGGPSMTSVFSQIMLKQGELNPSIIAISAAMDKGTGLSPFREKWPQRFFDVGITEPLAVTMAAAMTRTGLKPVVAIYSTFMQRAVDQIIHDTALNALPVLFVMDRAGLVPSDGQTHQGLFDMTLFRSVPSIEILAPVTAGDLSLSMDYGLAADHPVFIRIPKEVPLEDEGEEEAFLPGRGFFCKDYRKPETRPPLLIINLGSLLEEAKAAADILAQKGVDAEIYQLRWAWPLDLDFLIPLIDDYEMVLFIEEGMQQGGIGESLAAALLKERMDISFIHSGVPSLYLPAASRSELCVMAGLDRNSLADQVTEVWDKLRFEKVVDQVRKDSWKTRNI